MADDDTYFVLTEAPRGVRRPGALPGEGENADSRLQWAAEAEEMPKQIERALDAPAASGARAPLESEGLRQVQAYLDRPD